jgi:hypothetical protein
MVFDSAFASFSSGATLEIDKECGGEAIALFERSVQVENLTPDIKANMLQAMHVPYACLGRMSTAIELLRNAEQAARLVGKAGKIFCVKTYTNLSVEEFLGANAEMVNALRLGELWDGMPLPEAHEKEQP